MVNRQLRYRPRRPVQAAPWDILALVPRPEQHSFFGSRDEACLCPAEAERGVTNEAEATRDMSEVSQTHRPPFVSIEASFPSSEKASKQ